MPVQMKLLSALEKVFLDQPINATATTAATALRGEVFSFQCALCYTSFDPERYPIRYQQTVLRITTKSALPVQIREVANVPVEITSLGHDCNFLSDHPGLFPDPLVDLDNTNLIRLDCGFQRSLWLTVRIPQDIAPGDYAIEISAENIGTAHNLTNTPDTVIFTLTVLAEKQPEQTFFRYEWLHLDCLAAYYDVEMWSEKHWQVIENFIANGANHGLNILYTPLWTPPLDTGVGHERLTTQLLDIYYQDGVYSFNFERLRRYLQLGLKYNMKLFAMSHAFTQWGAKATPKIIINDQNGAEVFRFGWHIASDDPRYADFLRQLMDKLLPFFSELGLDQRILFSASDEPVVANANTYLPAAKLLRSVLKGQKIIEALSDREFLEAGTIDIPVPANNHIEPFVGAVKELWTYYCTGQEKEVSNRFIAMPAARTRVIGVLFYVYDIVGFLQWAFNFYLTHLSYKYIDPWRETGAGRWVQAGDAFIVYPGKDGQAIDSLRHEVFYDAIQDYQALRLLEQKTDRQTVLELIHSGLDYQLRMDKYPHSSEWLLGLRQRVNKALVSAK